MLENNQLKLSNGKHVAIYTTLIQSARRAKKIITIKLARFMKLIVTQFNIQMIKMQDGHLRRENTPTDIH